jgi:hypothetical protein
MFDLTHTPAPKTAAAAAAKVRAWLGLLGLVMALLAVWSVAAPVHAKTTTAHACTVTNTSQAQAEQPSVSVWSDASEGSPAQGADPDDLESDLQGFSPTTSTLVSARHLLQITGVDAEFLNSPLRRPPRRPHSAWRV